MGGGKCTHPQKVKAAILTDYGLISIADPPVISNPVIARTMTKTGEIYGVLIKAIPKASLLQAFKVLS
jgi:hypothetical protein